MNFRGFGVDLGRFRAISGDFGGIWGVLGGGGGGMGGTPLYRGGPPQIPGFRTLEEDFWAHVPLLTGKVLVDTAEVD